MFSNIIKEIIKNRIRTFNLVLKTANKSKVQKQGCLNSVVEDHCPAEFSSTCNTPD